MQGRSDRHQEQPYLGLAVLLEQAGLHAQVNRQGRRGTHSGVPPRCHAGQVWGRGGALQGLLLVEPRRGPYRMLQPRQQPVMLSFTLVPDKLVKLPVLGDLVLR